MKHHQLYFLLCGLLFAILVEVNSEDKCVSFPYLTFMGECLDSHSYIDINRLRNITTRRTNPIECHTGLQHGAWFFPNLVPVPVSSGEVGYRVIEREQQVDLIYDFGIQSSNGSAAALGIFQCVITDTGDRDYVGIFDESSEPFLLY